MKVELAILKAVLGNGGSMKSFLTFFIKVLPFTVGVILVLTSLTFLVQFTDQILDLGDFGDEEFWTFVFFA